MIYANVIVDISLEKLDKTFQYIIPSEMEDEIEVGVQVDVPFGNRTLTGYVLEITEKPEYDVSKLKPIIGISNKSVAIEAQLIALAGWMRKNYGSTMNQALKTVLPVKKKTKNLVHKTIVLTAEMGKAREELALCENKKYTAKARLLRELIEAKELDYTLVTQKLGVSSATITGFAKRGFLKVEEETFYRNPMKNLVQKGYHLTLNEEQQKAVDQVLAHWEKDEENTYLLKGVTGSGKTEVYMELIAKTIERGKQAIVLIPEIALTYQTVMRFYHRFGDRVSVMNSKLSTGEKYDQFERAKHGDVDIMIGPRSALFAPFPNLGLIIIDEEHETSYKSENVPRYHAREVAIYRAKQNHATVILGSATPSVESYYMVKQGLYHLLELKSRVKDNELPDCEIVDLREELRHGNRSILSKRLQELISDRLEKKQQIMLFLNRRGMSGFVSCRECGHVLKCPHCDVSLSLHKNGRMLCHYCGYEEPAVSVCPSCGSKYIGGFKAGTQKVEEAVQKLYPSAKILRMDFDTTRTKDSYENILSAFANQEADILIGTQMIVKGHDFPNVTLVGVLAADLSLHVSDYHASERTFQLLTQAVGRAGRGEEKGEAIIQTYNPEHYAIVNAKAQDYESFYEMEMEYRQILNYPPVWNMLYLLITSENQNEAITVSEEIYQFLAKTNKVLQENQIRVQLIGPADAGISKINDVHRRVIYMKTASYGHLIWLKDQVEKLTKEKYEKRPVTIQFDFNPSSGF